MKVKDLTLEDIRKHCATFATSNSITCTTNCDFYLNGACPIELINFDPACRDWDYEFFNREVIKKDGMIYFSI